MNLLDQMMESCRIMNHIRQDDEYGGYTDEWVEGASFDAAVSKNSSTEALIAQQQGLNEMYTVVVRKGFPLSYHDVFKRVSDGQIFRVTSNTADSESHPASTVRIAKVTAERWEIPT